MDTVLLVGIGSFHARFVAENQRHFPGLRWVWTHAPASVWDEENQRAKENELYLQGLGMTNFDPNRDSYRLLGILVLTGDGRLRAEEYKQWSSFGCPIYLDKPVCTQLEELEQLKQLAKCLSVPWATGSSMRFFKGWTEFVESHRTGMDRIQLWAPWPVRSGRAGWCWYGVHALELLAQAVGGGSLRSVRVNQAGDDRFLEAECADGRIAEVRSTQSFSELRARIHCGGTIAEQTFVADGVVLYRGLLEAILNFFRTGKLWYSVDEMKRTANLLHHGWRSQQTGGMKQVMIKDSDIG